MGQTIIIVGGVAGGATAATRLRRLSEEDHIVMFERDEHISFANCGLPYYIGGVIEQRDSLIVETKENLSAKFNLDIRNFSEVIRIDKSAKTVTVREVKTGREYQEHFDKLILSPGANPIVPPTPGIKSSRVFTLRNIPDTDKIKNYITTTKPQSAVIIGGGFIGVEMAENLVELGIETTIIDLANQILAPLDFDMAKLAENEMRRHGVNFFLEDVVETFEDDGKTLKLKSGKVLSTDLVILAIGVKPESKLAVEGGLKVGPRGHIVTSKTLQTYDAVTGDLVTDIYAVGDAIEVYDLIDDSKTAIALAWPANRQARLVADHIHGMDVSYDGSLGTSVAKVFDLVMAATGNNTKILDRKKIAYKSIIVSRHNHAGYYPGASDIMIKLIFDATTGRIYGAQAVGEEGTEKRIDVIATAMKGNLKVMDLPHLELSYAPPFGSAKDPVNIAGYAASNLIKGDYDVVSVFEVKKLIDTHAMIIDARTALEFNIHHLPTAINLPYATIRQKPAILPTDKDTPLYVYCNTGWTSYNAIMTLRHLGYTHVYNISGGIKLYKEVYEPVTASKKKASLKPQLSADAGTIKIKVNAQGLQCPGPIMKTYQAVDSLLEGEQVQVEASDPGFASDVEKWAASTGNTLISNVFEKGVYRAVVQKGSTATSDVASAQAPTVSAPNTTLVLFSGDMDKAMASMIIAQGARAMGKNVTIFCTFWGLSLLRKTTHVKVKKTFIEKMFGWMLPKGPDQFTISKMNMLGMGTAMMKGIMKKKNVDSLATLMNEALAAGVNIMACTMSMDVMGIKKEELIDGISYGGVASYLAESDKAGVTLFI